MDAGGAVPGDEWLPVTVSAVIQAVRHTRILDLVPVAGVLPDFEPGGHVALRCGDVVRHYSLFGPRTQPAAYRIAVKLEDEGRGGSRWLFEHAVVGARLEISRPRNNFPLVRGRPRYAFIAGGIGVTPILSMLEALREAGVQARCVYLCRSPEDFAFAERLEAERAHHDLHLHHDSTSGIYDIEAELRRHDDSTEIYCCGPMPLMDVVRRYADSDGRAERFHFEFFSASPVEEARAAAVESEFEILAQRLGRVISVRSDQSMLDALRAAGIAIESECEEGVCGTCIVDVLAGEPDHRDYALTRAERESGKRIATCVSRSRTPQIVLDV